jgi:hypothetical protein
MSGKQAASDKVSSTQLVPRDGQAKETTENEVSLEFVAGQPGNFTLFTDFMYSRMMAKYGDLGMIFKTDAYPTFTLETRPTAAALARNHYAEEAWKQRNKMITQKEFQFEEDKKKLYGEIWTRLTTQSKQRVMAHAQFDERDVDPLSLWTKIKSTHIGGLTGNNTADMDNAEDYYNSLHQHSGEDIHTFKRRFDDAVKAMTAAGITPHSQATLARHFTHKLNNSYSDYKDDLRKFETLGMGTAMTQLSDAYEKAGR